MLSSDEREQKQPQQQQNNNSSDCYCSKPTASSQQAADDQAVKKAMCYTGGLLERLRQQRRESPDMCDMSISVDDQTYRVHKCLMIASCDYFDAMWRSGMQETRQQTIELKGLSAQGLNEVIDFIYSGELRLSLSNIGDILRAVSHLQVQHALKLCEEYLIEETTVENCIEMLNLADMFCINNVKMAVNNFIFRNFDKLTQTDQYKKFTLEQMCFYLQSNKLRLYPEIRVFKACLNWLKGYNSTAAASSATSAADLQSPQSSAVYQLMQHVRFCTMKPEEFVDIVAKTELIKNDPKCNEILIEGYEYFALPNRQYCSSSPRALIRNEPVMVCVNESMYILNRREEIWQYLCHSAASCKTISQKFIVVNNFLYACGGYSESNRETCDKCHRFDPRTASWYPIASMNEKRQFFTLAGNNECIVAVGGVYGAVGNFYATNPVCSPIELYSIEKDTWSSLKDCKVPILKWPGACLFTKPSDNNNDETSATKYVFIVGGKLADDEKRHTLSPESYIVNLSTCQVEEVCAPPITNRFNPSVFFDANGEKIILFGGEDEKYRMAPCIEIFNLRTRQWSEVATIPVSLSYQGISSTSMIQSKIYYLLEEHDGPSSESYNLKSAYFDINTWQFEVPIQLPHPSTLASKWCCLVFPREFLEKCQGLSSSSIEDPIGDMEMDAHASLLSSQPSRPRSSSFNPAKISTNNSFSNNQCCSSSGSAGAAASNSLKHSTQSKIANSNQQQSSSHTSGSQHHHRHHHSSQNRSPPQSTSNHAASAAACKQQTTVSSPSSPMVSSNMSAVAAATMSGSVSSSLLSGHDLTILGPSLKSTTNHRHRHQNHQNHHHRCVGKIPASSSSAAALMATAALIYDDDDDDSDEESDDDDDEDEDEEDDDNDFKLTKSNKISSSDDSSSNDESSNTLN